MHLRPFSGLMPASNEAAARVASPPYDVVSLPEARAVLHRHPDSFLAVVRPDAVVPQGTPPYIDAVYEAAAQNLRRLVDCGLLVERPEKAVYVYEQENAQAGFRQRGIVALVNVCDYDAEVIKKHETTRPEKEDDRTHLAETLAAHTGPVFLTYRDVNAIDAIVDATASEGEPLFDVTGDDKVRHRVWRMGPTKSATLVVLFEQHVQVSYIADGHHRAAAAARVARRRLTPDTHEAPAADDSSWFPAVLFPQSHLTILPYNRLVHDLNGIATTEFVSRLATIGEVHELNAPPAKNPPPGSVFVFVDDSWFTFRLPNATTGNTSMAGRLDCSILQSAVLGPLLGIDDPRVCSRIEFVGGVRGLGELEKRVRAQGSGVAFAMSPVAVEDLMHVADRGGVMPPKSTWFEPKLRSGFFVHLFD
jgi:uncharacterized protein (DUF1015 family)